MNTRERNGTQNDYLKGQGGYINSEYSKLINRADRSRSVEPRPAGYYRCPTLPPYRNCQLDGRHTPIKSRHNRNPNRNIYGRENDLYSAHKKRQEELSHEKIYGEGK